MLQYVPGVNFPGSSFGRGRGGEPLTWQPKCAIGQQFAYWKVSAQYLTDPWINPNNCSNIYAVCRMFSVALTKEANISLHFQEKTWWNKGNANVRMPQLLKQPSNVVFRCLLLSPPLQVEKWYNLVVLSAESQRAPLLVDKWHISTVMRHQREWFTFPPCLAQLFTIEIPMDGDFGTKLSSLDSNILTRSHLKTNW